MIERVPGCCEKATVDVYWSDPSEWDHKEWASPRWLWRAVGIIEAEYVAFASKPSDYFGPEDALAPVTRCPYCGAALPGEEER